MKNIVKGLKNTVLFSLFSFLVFALILFLPDISTCKVLGICANCHTMHNSRDGSDLSSEGPLSSLLTNTCVGCHSHSSDATYDLGGCTVPVVYTTGGISYNNCLAGGNFYWVEHSGDIYGHNAVADTDEILDMAPGLSDKTGAIGCAGSCHYKLAQWEWRWWGCPSQHRENVGVGCVGCHTPAHHKGGSATAIADEEDGSFRFLARKHKPVPGPNTDLRNVKGWEDNDWQKTVSSDDHNEYYDNYTFGGYGSSGISRFCVACHTDYHSVRFGPNGSGSGWIGNWLRHPVSIHLPGTGECSKYNTDGSGPDGAPGLYNPDAPVSRPNIDAVIGPSAIVSVGANGDMVSCLSCHRAHGSPYADMLRWDYDEMIAGGGEVGTGCFVCHTGKDE